MRTVVREKLRKYLSEHGKDVLQEPEALRLYLLREEGRFSQEIDGLLRLLEEGLLPPFPEEGERQSFLQKVVREIGVSPEDAEWLLDSWEEAWEVLEPPRENSSQGLASESSEDSSGDVSSPLSSFQMFLTNPAAFTPQTTSSAESFLRSSLSPREEAEPASAESETEGISPPQKEGLPEAPPDKVAPEIEQMFAMSPSGEEKPDVQETEIPGEASFAESLEAPEEPLPHRRDVPQEGLLFGIDSEGNSSEENVSRENSFSEEAASPQVVLPEEEVPSEEPLREDEYAGISEGPEGSEEPEVSGTPQVSEEISLAEDAEEPRGEKEPLSDYVGVQETQVLLDDSLRRKRIFRLALAGICGLLAAVSVGYFMWRNTPENLLERGRSRFEKKDYAGAALLFQKALDKEEENPEGYQLLGEALYQKGEYQEALGAYEESLKRVSGDAFLYNDIAYAQLGLENLEEASATFREVLRTVPLFPQARKGLALTYFQQGKLQSAMEELQRALESIPEDAEMLLALGKIHAESGDLDQGEVLFARVLDLDPDNESARLAMEDLARERSLREAQEAARAARLSEYLEAGETLLVSGEISQGEAMYRKALEEAPESLEARGGLLDALLMQHRSEDARMLVSETQGLEDISEKAPDFVNYLTQTLASYERAFQEREARHEAYEMAIARASEMREKRQFEGALAAYRGILEEEEYPPAYIGLGRTLAKQGEYSQALEAYERGAILLSSPEKGGIPENIAREMENLRKALTRQELEKELEPLYTRARTLERQGKTREARELYESILQRDPQHRNARNRLEILSRKPRETSVSGQEASPSSSEKDLSAPQEPPPWLLLPDGQPALLEMHRQEELRNLRQSLPSETQGGTLSLTEKVLGDAALLGRMVL